VCKIKNNFIELVKEQANKKITILPKRTNSFYMVYLSCKTNPDISPNTEPKIICKSAEYQRTYVLLNNKVFKDSFSLSDISNKDSFKIISDSTVGSKTKT